MSSLRFCAIIIILITQVLHTVIFFLAFQNPDSTESSDIHIVQIFLSVNQTIFLEIQLSDINIFFT